MSLLEDINLNVDGVSGEWMLNFTRVKTPTEELC